MLKAFIFDMDGTLTEPYINWRDLRSSINCPLDKTIIEHIDSLPPDEANRANDILLKTEWEAGQYAEIREGARELIDELKIHNIKLAVVTNNHGAAMQRVIERLDRTFDATFSRDDGPIKPEPYLIHQALKTLNTSPTETLSIGDSQYDLMACAVANVQCIHLNDGTSEINHTPCVTTLKEAMPLLHKHQYINPPSKSGFSPQSS